MHFRVISKVTVQNRDIVFGRYNFKYFSVLDIPDIFRVNRRCTVQAYVGKKKIFPSPGVPNVILFIFSHICTLFPRFLADFYLIGVLKALFYTCI